MTEEVPIDRALIDFHDMTNLVFQEEPHIRECPFCCFHNICHQLIGYPQVPCSKLLDEYYPFKDCKALSLVGEDYS